MYLEIIAKLYIYILFIYLFICGLFLFYRSVPKVKIHEELSPSMVLLDKKIAKCQ